MTRRISATTRLFASLMLWTAALAIAEGVLRWSGRVHIPPAHVATDRPDLYQEYRPYGYRLWPSRALTYEYPGTNPRRLTVHSNRNGFRTGRDFDDVDPRPRVVVLGDSMVFGDGVEEDERFTERIEREHPSLRVENLGMTGFGPDLMLRALEHVGLGVHPQAVVLTMYTDDFRRVRPEYAGVGFEIPKYTLASGQLTTIEYPRFAWWQRLSLVSAAREVVWRTSGTEWTLNAAILDRVRELARDHQFDLVFTFLPGTSDTPNDQERRQWLRSYADRTATAFIDLTEPILHADRELFIRNNWHLNPDGHAVVARELGRLLMDGFTARRTSPSRPPS